MSSNRITPHPAAGYIEAVVDGHEDWMSAVQTIEQIGALIDEFRVYRILLDFAQVDMRVATVEAPDLAKLFHAFTTDQLSFGIVRSGDVRSDATIEAFAAGMRALGHGVEYLESRAATSDWVGMPPDAVHLAG